VPLPRLETVVAASISLLVLVLLGSLTPAAAASTSDPDGDEDPPAAGPGWSDAYASRPCNDKSLDPLGLLTTDCDYETDPEAFQGDFYIGVMRSPFALHPPPLPQPTGTGLGAVGAPPGSPAPVYTVGLVEGARQGDLSVGGGLEGYYGHGAGGMAGIVQVALEKRWGFFNPFARMELKGGGFWDPHGQGIALVSAQAGLRIFLSPYVAIGAYAGASLFGTYPERTAGVSISWDTPGD
jgi:hypothetical protein